MAGKETEHSTIDGLKSRIGALIIDANSEILQLQDGFKRVQTGGSLNKQELVRESALKTKIKDLEENTSALKLEAQKGNVDIEKYLKLINTTIVSADIILTKDTTNEIDVIILKDTQAQVENLMSVNQEKASFLAK